MHSDLLGLGFGITVQEFSIVCFITSFYFRGSISEDLRMEVNCIQNNSNCSSVWHYNKIGIRKYAYNTINISSCLTFELNILNAKSNNF